MNTVKKLPGTGHPTGLENVRPEEFWDPYALAVRAKILDRHAEGVYERTQAKLRAGLLTENMR